MIIQEINSLQTYNLRQKILRPHQPIKAMAYPGDDLPTSFHIGGLIDSQVEGIASVYMEGLGGTPAEGIYRLRGMAVSADIKGQGFGGQLLQRVVEEVRGRRGQKLWCNARTSAGGFYEKFQFQKHGDEFEIQGIGPHFIMELNI